jgi:hypothetical protein
MVMSGQTLGWHSVSAFSFVFQVPHYDLVVSGSGHQNFGVLAFHLLVAGFDAGDPAIVPFEVSYVSEFWVAFVLHVKDIYLGGIILFRSNT